jgi:hypothetical protein
VPAVVGDGIQAQARIRVLRAAASRRTGTLTRCLPARYENVLQALL